MRELDTTYPDFIYAACEFLAKNAEEVTTEHVATVLAWIASTNAKNAKETEA